MRASYPCPQSDCCIDCASCRLSKDATCTVHWRVFVPPFRAALPSDLLSDLPAMSPADAITRPGAAAGATWSAVAAGAAQTTGAGGAGTAAGGDTTLLVWADRFGETQQSNRHAQAIHVRKQNHESRAFRRPVMCTPCKRPLP